MQCHPYQQNLELSPSPTAGVLHTHCSVGAQVDTLCAAWGWAPSDRILHALPLHHIHGLVNALLCALRSGAAVEFMPKFSPGEAWQRLTVRGGLGARRVEQALRPCWGMPIDIGCCPPALSVHAPAALLPLQPALTALVVEAPQDSRADCAAPRGLPLLQREENPVTLFMAVPTMYSFLLHSYDRLGPEAQGVARAAAGRLRLAVSGSSACPLPVMARWEELSGGGC